MTSSLYSIVETPPAAGFQTLFGDCDAFAYEQWGVSSATMQIFLWEKLKVWVFEYESSCGLLMGQQKWVGLGHMRLSGISWTI